MQVDEVHQDRQDHKENLESEANLDHQEHQAAWDLQVLREHGVYLDLLEKPEVLVHLELTEDEAHEVKRYVTEPQAVQNRIITYSLNFDKNTSI